MAMTALVVSRDEITRSFFEGLLAGPDGTTVFCGDAQAALARCREAEFELVLVDLGVSGHGGLGFCQELATVSWRDRCLVLVVASGSRVEDLQAALDAGADDYIRRPLDAQLIRIRLAVAEKRLQSLRNTVA